VIIDPITGFDLVGGYSEIKTMLTRLVDMMKARGITALMADLTSGGDPAGQTNVGISSLIDTWLVLRNLEQAGERNRGLYIIKSRGMKHSNQVREFVLIARGIDLIDVRLGSDGVLLGSARLADEAREQDAALQDGQEAKRKRQILERKRISLDARIAALPGEFGEKQQEAEGAIAEPEQVRQVALQARVELAGKRADSDKRGKSKARKTS
jgi:circadian clock protein KaiC